MIEFDGDLQYCGFQPHLRAQKSGPSTTGLALFALMTERAFQCPKVPKVVRPLKDTLDTSSSDCESPYLYR